MGSYYSTSAESDEKSKDPEGAKDSESKEDSEELETVVVDVDSNITNEMM